MREGRREFLAGMGAAWLALGIRPSVARAGQRLEFRLPSGPHAPSDAPDVAVHLPSRLDARAPVHWLIFLHGFSSCARALMAEGEAPCQGNGPPQRGYGLAALHERTRGNTLLIVPQLAFLTRDARAHRFQQQDGFARFVAELRGLLAPSLRSKADPASITLLAHSAGYHAASCIVASDGPHEVRNVVLFDALYAHWDVFARWLEQRPSRQLISLYTHDRDTTEGNRKLAALLRRAEPPVSDRLRIERVNTPHRLVPERHLESVLDSLFRVP
ncbi:MAG TPA: hypothetical protein VFZ61_20060 [Polyangiales bacterium]